MIDTELLEVDVNWFDIDSKADEELDELIEDEIDADVEPV